MKQRRDRHRREFVRRQAIERLMFVMLMSMTCGSLSPERMIWTKERSSHLWEHIVKCTFTPTDWLENFRMSQSTFVYLCDELRSSIEKNDTVMRKPVPTDVRVAITLWFLATGAIALIGHLFGMSKSKVCVVLEDVCSAIVKSLLPRYISFPTGVGLREILRMTLAFPNVLELWMDLTFLLSHHRSVQLIIIIVNVGTLSSCKVLLTIKAVSLTSL